MTQIHVCSLSKLQNTIQLSKAQSVISLVNAGISVPYPLSIPLENRLRLTFNDIEKKLPGYIEPKERDIRKFLAFINSWNKKQALIIHCWMGVSRSTAAAFIALCNFYPEKDERSLAKLIREKSPEATPNKRLVALADEFLQRNGSMVDAIHQIGRGKDCFEGRPFYISVTPT